MAPCNGWRIWHGETLSDRALQGEVLRQPLMAPELLLLWPWDRLLRFCCLCEWGRVPGGAHRLMGFQIVVSMVLCRFLDRWLAHGLPRGFMG